jgi:7,8-dihydropterin-6-yl-methyl-4-(beta-D-ribofuranosyl)aminobenzene 5'-phosphate synthase
MRNIISHFKKLDVRYVGPCHCTGDKAKQLFQREYGKKFIHVGVGKVINLEALK